MFKIDNKTHLWNNFRYYIWKYPFIAYYLKVVPKVSDEAFVWEYIAWLDAMLIKWVNILGIIYIYIQQKVEKLAVVEALFCTEFWSEWLPFSHFFCHCIQSCLMMILSIILDELCIKWCCILEISYMKL